MPPKVVNLKETKTFDVYIGRGRGSIWGNPFSHLYDTQAKYHVASRGEAIRCYKEWLLTQPKLLARLPELRGKILGCWCAPLPCHGEILMELANAPTLEERRKANAEKLAAIAKRLEGCKLCPLNEGRTNIVMGSGDPVAELVFIGEAPGAEEDKQGLPFVGRSGQLLDKMIAAMGLSRSEVWIGNVNKCRPPSNRPPTEAEMKVCVPFLKEQLAIIDPKVIITLGKTAAVGLGLLKASDPLSKVRGKWSVWTGGSRPEGAKVMPTFHPSYLLRSPQEKGKTWGDLQATFPFLARRKTEAK